MDPIAAGVGFLLGVLTAGAGALFQAQLLEGRHERALRRALISEMRENVQRLASAGREIVPTAPVLRSAWDQARSLPLSNRRFDAIAAAYVAGDEVQASISMLVPLAQ